MASSPTKETTPTSDVKVAGSAAGEKKEEKNAFSLFTEKEQKATNAACITDATQLLVAAMFCLKGGPPEIDYNKFVKAGEFNTLKTAQNTWGKIKGKLATIAPKVDEEGAEGETGEAATTPKTPKAKVAPKKRVKKEAAEGDDAEEGSPKKKKTPAKKGKKAEAAAAEEVKEGTMGEAE
ncbi:hypothetical protein LTR85_004539 [Meristemomyces frigidus]|nr:hypothetical protein LTR85_004539 [Meristemomyces frigidus]